MKKKESEHKRRKINGRIAGQSMKKDTVTTLLFKTNNENFAELFNRTLPVGAPISAETLADGDIKETAYLRITKKDGGTALVQYRDVVKEAMDGRVFAVLGIENQSEIDYAMPYRVLELDFVHYARQMQVIRDRHETEWRRKDGRRHRPSGVTSGEYLGRFLKADRIVRCITLVVYWGTKPWDGPTRLSELFDGETDMPGAVQLDINLLDVCRMSDAEICSYTGELRTVFGFRKYADNKEKLKAFISENQSYFNSVSRTAVDALVELTHSPELEEIKTSKYETPKGGFNVCLGIQGMIQDGKMEGRREGLKEGKTEGKMEGKRESLLTWLEAYGTVPDWVKKRILNTTSMPLLDDWVKIAARAASMKDFLERAGLREA